MSRMTARKALRARGPVTEAGANEVEAEKLRASLLADFPCPYYFRDIELDCQGDRVVISGRLQSFALKQVLDSRISNAFVDQDVEDRVIVVNSQGLSSEPVTTASC